MSELFEDPDLLAAVEALLFSAAAPVPVAALAQALGDRDPQVVTRALEALEQRCDAERRGVVVRRVAGGWQLRTHPRFSAAILRLIGARPQKLSRAALEVLAIVAYEQPVTRGRVEQVRGVGCGRVIKNLLERGLVRTAGRRNEPGRPLQYATTRTFLEVYGLPGLSSLPTIEEKDALDES